MEPTVKSVNFSEHSSAHLTVTNQTTDLVSAQRIGQNQLLPQSIKRRVLGDIVTTSHVLPSGGYRLAVTFPDAQTNVTRFFLRDTFNRTMMAFPTVAVYVGGPAGDQDYAWPYASYAMNNFPISIIPNDKAYSDGVNVVTTVACRNSSGAAVDGTIDIAWTIITNAAANFQEGQNATS